MLICQLLSHSYKTEYTKVRTVQTQFPPLGFKKNLREEIDQRDSLVCAQS